MLKKYFFIAFLILFSLANVGNAMSQNFFNKCYVIFGGSNGIGYELTKELLKRQAHVTIVSRSKEPLEQACLDLQKISTEINSSQLDITDENALEKFFEHERLFDGVICTAGKSKPGNLFDLSANDIKESFDSKFIGQVNIVKYALPRLKKGSSIILTSGIYGVLPKQNVPILASVNGAIESFIKATALDIAYLDIRINGVSPGYVATDRLKEVMKKEGSDYEQNLTDKIPLARIALPQEIAEAYIYLLSCNYATGNIIYTDGGMTLR